MCQTSRFAPVLGQDDGSAAWVWVWGCQRNDAWPEAWFLSWATLSWDFRRLTRWFSAQVSHLVRFGTAGFGQSLHSSRDLASSRLAWATRQRSYEVMAPKALVPTWPRPSSAGTGAGRLGPGRTPRPRIPGRWSCPGRRRAAGWPRPGGRPSGYRPGTPGCGKPPRLWSIRSLPPALSAGALPPAARRCPRAGLSACFRLRWSFLSPFRGNLTCFGHPAVLSPCMFRVTRPAH